VNCLASGKGVPNGGTACVLSTSSVTQCDAEIVAWAFRGAGSSCARRLGPRPSFYRDVPGLAICRQLGPADGPRRCVRPRLGVSSRSAGWRPVLLPGRLREFCTGRPRWRSKRPSPGSPGMIMPAGPGGVRRLRDRHRPRRACESLAGARLILRRGRSPIRPRRTAGYGGLARQPRTSAAPALRRCVRRMNAFAGLCTG